MILDVTAGNRVIWNKNRNPFGVIFIDKETNLTIPPHIIADNTHLPIRRGINITSIIFDPPWGVNMPPWLTNPKTRPSGTRPSFYGDFKSKRELFSYIHKAQREFQQYTRKLCLKWGERNIPLWNILPFFRDWVEIHRVKLNAKMNRQGQSTNQTWWVVLVRSSLRRVSRGGGTG